MYLIQPQSHSRRAFLRRSGQLALTGAALPTALNLAAMGEAAAFNAPSDSYKALVCVFLSGGNDYANTVVAYDDPSYDLYSAIRGGRTDRTGGGITLPKSALTPNALTPTTAALNPNAAVLGNRQFALHPSMTGLAGLFNSGKAAVQLNVGPLVVPTNKTQYQGSNRTANPLPPKLFSHNDQQSLWQSSSPEGSTIGWGGNIGDLALNSNSNSLFTCISVTGNAVFLAGDSALSYQVSSSQGAIRIKSANDNVYGSSALKGAMNQLLQQARSHVLENEYNTVTKRAIGAEGAITSSITGAADGTSAAFAPLNAVLTTTIDGVNRGNNNLATQLKMVARLIAAQKSLGTKRQVFFVSLGGFDLHDNLMTGHTTNMARVSQAMTAFYETTKLLGQTPELAGLENNVTAFTASDFGRTMSSNGDGSDHGWGSHHVVVGGAVKGKAFYGYAPPVGAGNTPDPAGVDAWHVGQGRLIPTTSVDQYAATLARWFGVEDTELNGILPNLPNFDGRTQSGIVYPRTLGFV